MTMGITPQHNDYRLNGTIAFADSGATRSKIQLFATEHPTLGGTPVETPIVVIELAVPCGAVTGHALVLSPFDPAGSLVSDTGTAIWARWVNGDDVLIADGTVSDSSGTGDFKIAGTSGTTLYAGARVFLGTSAIG